MKAIAILPAAAAAMLAFSVSMASSQDICVREFQGCMDGCGLKQTKSMQDTCFAGCETKNDMCSERVFGARGGAATVQTAPAVAPPAKDAMAKKEPRGRDQKRVQKQAPAPAAEQQEQAPAAAEPEQAPPAR
jgi:hypothetical protein